MRSARVQQTSFLSQYNVRGRRGHLENTSLQVARRAITVIKGPALQGHSTATSTPRLKIQCDYCAITIWYPHASRKYCTPVCSGKAKAQAQRLARWAKGIGPRNTSKKLCRVCQAPLRDKRWRHCSIRCRNWSPKLPSQTKSARRMRARRTAILGRKCTYCKRTDQQTQFHSDACCSVCYQQMQRRQCSRCGGPFYVNKNSRGVLGCLLSHNLVPGDTCEHYV